MTSTSTCQICARAVKQRGGLIALHGYKRRLGWQSNSCYGARHRPYEESCEACKQAVTSVTEQRESVLAASRQEPDSVYLSTGKGEFREISRGVFEQVAAAHQMHWLRAQNPPTWAEAVQRRNRELASTADSMQRFIIEQQARVKAWKGTRPTGG